MENARNNSQKLSLKRKIPCLNHNILDNGVKKYFESAIENAMVELCLYLIVKS